VSIAKKLWNVAVHYVDGKKEEFPQYSQGAAQRAGRAAAQKESVTRVITTAPNGSEADVRGAAFRRGPKGYELREDPSEFEDDNAPSGGQSL
jgi:hypothetical protein